MWPYPKVVAHRGAGSLAPENTLAAMAFGLQRGFHAVEFDVMLSQDDVPVLMHDPEFGRTVAGSGWVAQTLAKDLLQMDAGAWHSATFAGEKVPSYEEVVRFCQANQIWMNVEIKPSPGTERRTGEVVGQLTARLFAEELRKAQPNPARLPLFSSFSAEALRAARLAAPAIPQGFLIDDVSEDWLERLQELQVVALHTNHKYLNAELTKAVRDAGYGVFCYTVNTRERATEILDWGVNGFCTDKIDVIPFDF